MLWDNPFYSRMPDPIGSVRVKDYEMPLVKITKKILSPGLHGVNLEAYALCAFVAPPGNGKRIPAEFMLDTALASGRVKPGDTLVEPTSGGTGIALAFCGKMHGIKVITIVADDMPEGKLLPLVRHGAIVLKESEAVALFPELERSPGTMKLAELYAEKFGAVFLNQYFYPANPESWETLVAPQVSELLPELTEAFLGLGSTGSIRGFAAHFKKLKKQNPSIDRVKTVGTRPYGSQKIDGLRDRKRLGEVAEWEHMVDYHEATDAHVADALSDKLFHVAGIPAGRSSGAALGMMDHYYLDQRESGILKDRSVAFLLFMDTHIPYVKIG